MVQNILVILIVAAALLLMVRKIYRTLKGKEQCGCEGCCKCSLSAANRQRNCNSVKKTSKEPAALKKH